MAETSPGAKVRLAEDELNELLAEHGLDLSDFVSNLTNLAIDWGQELGYKRALVNHHLPED